MGHPPQSAVAAARSTSFAANVSLEVEMQDAQARALAAHDARRHTPFANGVFSIMALLLAVGPLFPGARAVFGVAEAETVQAVVFLAWVSYESAALALYLLGLGSRVYAALARVDAVALWAALLALVYLSGTAVSPLWAVTLLASVQLAPSAPEQSRVVLLAIIVSHLTASAAFLWAGELSHAIFCAITAMTAIMGHAATAGTAQRAARARTERDVLRRRSEQLALSHEREQLARVLHDGIGADVTALFLSLRRAAKREADPETERLAAKAQLALERLRQLVKSLRQDQGTLEELARLIEARGSALCGESLFAHEVNDASSSPRVAPGLALAALQTATRLVGAAAGRPGVTQVRLTVTRNEALELRVEHDGPESGSTSVVVQA